MADEEKEKFAMGGFELKAFESLEREFQEVLQELQADKSLDRFRVEYEKLHRALKKSHESEKRLIKKCRELNTEILSNASKVQNALTLNEQDQNTILALKKEIDKAWKMVDASQEKEAKARDNIQQLKQEIANLSQIIEQGCGLSTGQEQELTELTKQKEDLILERDMHIDKIVQLRKEVTDWSEKQKVSEDQNIAMAHELTTVKEQLAAKKVESERELKKKERMEKDIKDLKTTLEVKLNDIRQKTTTVAESQDQVAKLEILLKEQKLASEKAVKDLDVVTQKVTKLHDDLEEQVYANTQLLAENSQRQVEMKLKDEETQVFKGEIARVNKIREGVMNKLKSAEKAKEDAERQRDSIKNDLVTLEREIEAQRKLTEHERKRQEDLLRERDVLNKLKTQAESAMEKQVDLVKINAVAVHNLEIELQVFRNTTVKQEKAIQQLEKEKQKYSAEATQAGVKYMQALDEVKSREVSVMELQKKIAESENKYKIQQNQYESVRSERNLYSKNLVESQDQIEELRRRIKIMTHQIEQLKEEINAKDQALIKEHADHSRIEKEREALKQDLSNVNQELKEAESSVSSHLSTIENLNHIITEADDERFRQKKELDVLKSERDILGTQLMRRNEELSLLYEKIKIQQSTLNKGQVQYRCRLNELRLLKIKITDLKREQSILKSSVNNIQVLKREVHNLSRELLQERTKVKALSEELENPLNVHRWRQLEGTDPSAYEMILKIQTLQKRLIMKTEQVVEKDLLIQEKEKLYVELRNILARQPGPEMVEKLAVYAKNLKDKTKQMKAMASELQMFQGHVYEYKAEISQLKSEIDVVKKKYYEQKKEQLRESQQHSNFSPVNSPLQNSSKGILGGGYNMVSP